MNLKKMKNFIEILIYLIVQVLMNTAIENKTTKIVENAKNTSSLTSYIIHRREVNAIKGNSNCSPIFEFKYDSSFRLSFISYDEESFTDYLKFKQLIAVKNDYELIILLFEDLSENKKFVLYKEYTIKVEKYRLFLVS